MSILAFRCSIKLGTQKLTGICGLLSGTTTLVQSKQQSAGITSAGGKPWIRERKPFDYRNKTFSFLYQPFDRTLARMDENSKVIVIDGPIASGKTEFAKKLAHQLDFKFVPQSNPKDLYVCGNLGLTYQDLDDLLPPEHRIYDHETFLKDPNPKLSGGKCRAGELQLDYFHTRLCTYSDALLHLLSTGQGVVCVRSMWSDRVFAKALHDNGYLSAAGFEYYVDEIALNHTIDFPRPHLVIYLDADVEETKDNIKRRNDPLEVNSHLFTDGFLQSMEDDYKDVVLPGLESHSEMLVYPSIPNITDHEVELMVEDIEALGDIKHSGISDDHFLDDWKYLRDEELAWKRKEYQNLSLANRMDDHTRPYHIPEMYRDLYFDEARSEIYDTEAGWRTETEYDQNLNPWWKTAIGIPLTKIPTERRKFWVPA